jgi:hypothetical protein
MGTSFPKKNLPKVKVNILFTVVHGFFSDKVEGGVLSFQMLF